MPVEDKPEEIDSPKNTRGGKTAIKMENISPTEPATVTPARRVTRRTSQLEDNNDANEEIAASPAIVTRRSTRARKNTATEEQVDTPGRRNAAPGTPQRRTRSSSIQSEEGNGPQVAVAKPPSEATIEEESLPVGRRTRASSVTSDDGSVINAAGTPKKRGAARKSLANIKIIEPVIEESEENHSPVRPVTRSMSNSPANVEKLSSPIKQKSPLVTKTPESKKTEEDADNADETIKSIAKDVSQKLSQEASPDVFSSPAGNKKAATPKATPKSTPNSAKKSPAGTPVTVKPAPYIATPFPTKANTGNDLFSKSWSQPVFGSASKDSKIDNGVQKLSHRLSMSAIKVQTKTLQVSSSSEDSQDEDDEQKNEFIDEAVEVTQGYESGDSMDDDEKVLAEENRMHEELGEDIGSEDSESGEEEDYDNDSFIASEGEDELLSYSDDDEHLEDSKEKNTSRKSAPGRLRLGSSEDDSDVEEVPTKKAQSEKKAEKSPKRTSIGQGTKLFNTSKVLKESSDDDEEEPMDIDVSLMINNSLKSRLNATESSDIELTKATEAQLVAANNSLLKSAKKSPAKPSPAKANEIADTEDASSNEENSSEDEEPMAESPVKESESAKRKRRRNSGMDDSIVQPVKKTKLNVSVVTDAKLDTILEKCNEILKTKKQEKQKNKHLHKKEKEEKKQRKELLKQKQKEEEGNGEGDEAADAESSGLKKKKKQKIGRKYNQDIEEPGTTQQEVISQALKRSQEILEKKRERKRLKKQAKLEKAKESGEEIVKKPKDKENLSNNKSEVDQQPKKPKTLLTAFEVKQQLLSTAAPPVVAKKAKTVAIPDKENSHNADKKQKKPKKSKILEPVHESNQSDGSPPSPPAKKRMLNILNPAGSLNKDGFIVATVTPDNDRLKRNRGFVEEPVTPKPIGFKVQSMLPSGEDFVKKANKKRKRAERDIPEPSRMPPKPVWTSSGAFEEIDAQETSDFIPLSTKSRAATQFGISVLNKKGATENGNGAATGLSSFKMKALYKDKSRMRESSKEIARKMEKEKFHKRVNA